MKPCFRPLTGIMILNYKGGDYMMNYLSTLVSVPLRGLWFLIIKTGDVYTRYYDDIVSVPLRGLWFLINHSLQILFITQYRCFRPLTRIVILNLWRSCIYRSKWNEVSVPLRGLWFLMLTERRNRVIEMKRVSVPLRGLWFLIWEEKIMNTVNYCRAKFPSPYGDYDF